jgi:KUP system potassium uptake protein
MAFDRRHGDRPSGGPLLALTVGALGVAFGDIGTSPLYALQIVYSLDGGVVRPTAAGVYGVVSLVFWALTLIVSVKYIAFVMRADNNGEGGILALTALVQRAMASVAARSRRLLVSLGVLGAALFYGRQRHHARDLRAVRGGGIEGRCAGPVGRTTTARP